MAYNSPHVSREERAILKTLGYSDLFDFPLTKDELWNFLVAEKPINRESFEHAMRRLCDKKRIVSILSGVDKHYYCLFRRESIVDQRIRNFPEVAKKNDIADRAARFLSYIPTISFIGVSGGLAIGDVAPSDDIDLFVITKKNTLFITRFWILVVLEVLGLRRVKEEKHPANKVCVNLLIDERKLAWDQSERDIFVAHEIVQLAPLFERDKIYQQFLEHNSWVRAFFPNVQIKDLRTREMQRSRQFYVLSFFASILEGNIAEIIARWTQKTIMKRDKSDVIVTNTILAFHPNDYRVKTLKKLRRKYQQLGLLTNI